MLLPLHHPVPSIANRRLSASLILVLVGALLGCSGLMAPEPDPAADAYCAELDRLRIEDKLTAQRKGTCQRELFEVRETAPATYACILQCPDKGFTSREKFQKCARDCRHFKGADFLETYVEVFVRGSGAEVSVETAPGATVMATVRGSSDPIEAVADGQGQATLSLGGLAPKAHTVSIETMKGDVSGQASASFSVRKQSFTARARKEREGDFPAPCTLTIQGSRIGKGLNKKQRLSIPFDGAGASRLTVAWTGLERFSLNGTAYPVTDDFVEIALDKRSLLSSLPASKMMLGQRASVEVTLTHAEEGNHTGTLDCGLSALTYESGAPYNVLDESEDRTKGGKAILIEKVKDRWVFKRHIGTETLARNVDFLVEWESVYESLGVSCPYVDSKGKKTSVTLQKQNVTLTVRDRMTGRDVASTALSAREPRCPTTLSAAKSALTGGVPPEDVDAWVKRVLPKR